MVNERLNRLPAVVIGLIGMGIIISGVEWYHGMISTPPSGEASFGGVTIMIFGVVFTAGCILIIIGIKSYKNQLVAIPAAASVASVAFIIAVKNEVHIMRNTQLGILKLLIVTSVPAILVWAGIRTARTPSKT